jgi:hypothetical protein
MPTGIVGELVGVGVDEGVDVLVGSPVRVSEAAKRFPCSSSQAR